MDGCFCFGRVRCCRDCRRRRLHHRRCCCSLLCAFSFFFWAFACFCSRWIFFFFRWIIIKNACVRNTIQIKIVYTPMHLKLIIIRHNFTHCSLLCTLQKKIWKKTKFRADDGKCHSPLSSLWIVAHSCIVLFLNKSDKKIWQAFCDWWFTFLCAPRMVSSNQRKKFVAWILIPFDATINTYREIITVDMQFN